jgi:tetratricopeptide (TPR) repeat protein
MPSPSTYRSNSEDAKLGTRLDCWKEIAAYLGKVERTVKRWEVDRGLPIHRVPGGGRASVYAYTGELDEWLKSTKAREPEAVLPEAALKAAFEEDFAEGESSDTVFDAADASAMADFPLPGTSAPRSVLTRSWFLASFALLFACVVVTAVYSAATRINGLRISPALQQQSGHLLAEPQPGVSSAASDAASDSEKSQARDLYLKGRYEWNQRTADSLNRALDYFTQAIVHDPGYAPAYVGLADTYDVLREYSTMPDNEAYARATAAASKALELDDSLAGAHRALAFSEWWGKWDFADGEKEFRRAIELDPKDPVAHKWYANVLAVQGRFSESLEQNDKARELDPTSHSILADRAIMLFNAGKKEEAIALLKEVERSAPEFLSPHNYLMIISLELRDYPAYLEEGKKTAEAENDPVLKGIIASARAGYERDGERGLLNDLYARQKEYYQAGKLWGTVLAKTCILMGRKQEALQLLEEAYNRHESNALSCLEQPDLLTLRDEPRFKALVKKIDFPSGPQTAQPSALPAENQPSLRASSDPHRTGPAAPLNW